MATPKNGFLPGIVLVGHAVCCPLMLVEKSDEIDSSHLSSFARLDAQLPAQQPLAQRDSSSSLPPTPPSTAASRARTPTCSRRCTSPLMACSPLWLGHTNNARLRTRDSPSSSWDAAWESTSNPITGDGGRASSQEGGGDAHTGDATETPGAHARDFFHPRVLMARHIGRRRPLDRRRRVSTVNVP